MEEFGYFSDCTKNSQGKSRTFEENRLLIFALQASLKRQLEKVARSQAEIMSINWSGIEQEVSTYFHVRREHVTALRRGFLEDGHVYIFGGDDRGQGAEGAKVSANTKVTQHMLQAISTYVDDLHSKGKGVVSRGIRNHLREKFNVKLHRTTVGRKLSELGLT